MVSYYNLLLSDFKEREEMESKEVPVVSNIKLDDMEIPDISPARSQSTQKKEEKLAKKREYMAKKRAGQSAEQKYKLRKEDRIRKALNRRAIATDDDDDGESLIWINQVRNIKHMNSEEKKEYDRERKKKSREANKSKPSKPKVPRWLQVKEANERYRGKKYMVAVDKFRDKLNEEGKVWLYEPVKKSDIRMEGDMIVVEGQRHRRRLEDVMKLCQNNKYLRELIDSLKSQQKEESKGNVQTDQLENHP